MRSLLTALVLAVCLCRAQSSEPFIEKPYLQLGDAPKLAKQESLRLLWHTASDSPDWSVEVRDGEGTKWRTMAAPIPQLVNVRTVPKHYVWRVTLSGLVPGQEFHYRVLKNST